MEKTNTKIVYDIIKNKILSCEYHPGQLVSEKEIVEGLNTSRTPVREALNILNGEGLLKIITKKGIQISPLSIKRMKEIYEIRRILEPISVRQAMKYIKPADIEYLFGLDEKLSDNYGREDITEVFRTGVDIHLYIARLSGNETLYALIKLLRDESYRGYVYYLRKYLNGCRPEKRDAVTNLLAGIHIRLANALKMGGEEDAVCCILEDMDTMARLTLEA